VAIAEGVDNSADDKQQIIEMVRLADAVNKSIGTTRGI
jgi:hypothetical protein